MRVSVAEHSTCPVSLLLRPLKGGSFALSANQVSLCLNLLHKKNTTTIKYINKVMLHFKMFEDVMKSLPPLLEAGYKLISSVC